MTMTTALACGCDAAEDCSVSMTVEFEEDFLGGMQADVTIAGDEGEENIILDASSALHLANFLLAAFAEDDDGGADDPALDMVICDYPNCDCFVAGDGEDPTEEGDEVVWRATEAIPMTPDEEYFAALNRMVEDYTAAIETPVINFNTGQVEALSQGDEADELVAHTVLYGAAFVTLNVDVSQDYTGLFTSVDWEWRTTELSSFTLDDINEAVNVVLEGRSLRDGKTATVRGVWNPETNTLQPRHIRVNVKYATLGKEADYGVGDTNSIVDLGIGQARGY